MRSTSIFSLLSIPQPPFLYFIKQNFDGVRPICPFIITSLKPSLINIHKILYHKPMSKQLGDEGERVAERFLKKKGYKIIERNYRTPIGEIDLIAKHRGQIVFIEVKTRQSLMYGTPIDAVDQRKRRRLGNLALLYLKQNRLYDTSVRFDVVGLTMKDGSYEVELITDAFEV
ncbi:MAG: YraN family protein [Nitrospirae bacterium]|nr:MAG: YraN family protein [Nitrospirota bacterium]